MGTKGASALGNVIWGNNTVYTVRHFNACPIVAVPASNKFNRPEEIVFVNDYKSQLSSQELNTLTDITKLWESTLVMFRVESEKGLTETQKLNKDAL